MRRLGLVILAAACAAGDDATDRSVRSDSAGVEIVHSREPEWVEPAGWVLSPEPTLDIGSDDGDPSHELFGVTGAIRLSNGLTMVANGRAGEIRLFDSVGAHIRTVGGLGEGPGEFRRINGLWPFRGDSVLAWDGPLARWTVLDTAGAFSRVFSPSLRGPNPTALPPLDDGTVVVAGLRLDPVPGEARAMYEEFLHYDAEGRFIDSLGQYRSFTGIVVEEGSLMSPIFDARLVRTAGTDGFWIGPASEYEIQRHDGNGRLVSRIRWDGPDRRVGAGDADTYKRGVLERFGDENARRSFAALLELLPVMDVFPAYQYAVHDRTGDIWLREYQRPGADPSNGAQWTVIAADGDWRGMITLPGDLVPLDIGGDYVLGVGRDDLDVEHVRLYELQRSRQ